MYNVGMADIIEATPRKTLRPDKDSIWGCPCGYKGKWHSVSAHRKGYKSRPECAAGVIFPIDPPFSPAQPMWEQTRAKQVADAEIIPTPSEPDASIIVEADNSARQSDTARPPVYEYTPNLDETLDPVEELARQWNQSRASNGGLDGTVPPDLRFDTPQAVVAPSQAREVVILPIIIRVYFDWAKSQGWHRGDGTLSAFVTDCLLCFFTDVLGKTVVVIDRKEVIVE